MKKKKDLKSSSSLDENDGNVGNKNELSKHHKMFVKNRDKMKQNSASSFEDDDDLTPGRSSSTEAPEYDIPLRMSASSQEELRIDEVDAPKSPPPVLPKPKPKKKPKIPPENKSLAKPASRSHNSRELAAQISQVKLKSSPRKSETLAEIGADNEDATSTTVDKNSRAKGLKMMPNKPIVARRAQASKQQSREEERTRQNLLRQDAVMEDDAKSGLYSSVDFSSMDFCDPYSSVDLDSVNPYAILDVGQSNSSDETKCTRSPSKSPPRDHVEQTGLNAVRISPTLGIKEVRSIVRDGASYVVGENNDVYSLPVKGSLTDKDARNSDLTRATEPLRPNNMKQRSTSHTGEVTTAEHGVESEGPYAETVLNIPTVSPTLQYEIPESFVRTSPPTPQRKLLRVEYDLKPPSSRPPPPPPGGSPDHQIKKAQRRSSTPIKHSQSFQDISIATSQVPSQFRQKLVRSYLSSSNESLDITRDSEPIFATRSDIGFKEEDANNNRHPEVTSPNRSDPNNGKTRYFPLSHSDRYYGNKNQRDPSQNSPSNVLPNIPPSVPPPPSSALMLDSYPMVVPPPPPRTDTDNSYIPSTVPPPPPMYPPPRLPLSERPISFNSQNPSPSDNSQQTDFPWANIESLPPPSAELMEEFPLYDDVH